MKAISDPFWKRKLDKVDRALLSSLYRATGFDIFLITDQKICHRVIKYGTNARLTKKKKCITRASFF